MKMFVGFLLLVASAAAFPNQSEKRLIKTDPEKPAVLLDQHEILNLIQNGQKFMDVTDFDYSSVNLDNINTQAIPTTLRFNATVRNVLSKLDTVREQQFLKTFSEFLNRYYSTPTGRSSQLWLYSEVVTSILEYAGNATAFEVDHGFLQRSIVARLEGEDPQLRNEVVVIGAHIDSVNGANVTGRSPGADDNGAGTAAVLEALRMIVDAQSRFNRSVEFHFYAAEEIGLRGSQAIAEDYRKRGVEVIGMLNLDVISHYASGVNDIAIITDYGNAEMAALVRLLVNGYLEFGLRERTCGYGCSDHASWDANGYPATMGIEAVSESWRHHTANDTLESVNFNQLNQFVNLATSLIVEMAEPYRP